MNSPSFRFAISILASAAPAVAQPPPLPVAPVPVMIQPAPPPVVVIGPTPGFPSVPPPDAGGGRITRFLEPLRPPGVVNDPSALGPELIGAAHHHLQPRPSEPTVAGAVALPRFKTPYSYGHFGPVPKRRWVKSYGYRDRAIEWTLR